MGTLNMLDTPTLNKLQPRPLSRIRGIVVHGSGETDLDKVLAYYRKSDDAACPHFLVETTGLVRRFCDLDRIANHAAMPEAERAAYSNGLAYWTRCRWDAKTKTVLSTATPRKCFDWWIRRWPGRQSPLALATGASPNRNSVGIELLSPITRGPRIYSQSQYEQLALVIVHTCRRLGLKIGPETVVAHSDANPLRRIADEAGAYDPGEKFDWDFLWSMCDVL